MAWRILGASVVGSAHQPLGIECQDAHEWIVLENGVVLICAADGAGSAKRSREGANAAIAGALQCLQLALARVPVLPDQALEDALWSALRNARSKVCGLAENEEENAASEFATTLIAVVITEQWVGMAQIGDGAVVVRRPIVDSLEVLSEAGDRQYVNETVFVTSNDAMDAAIVKVIPIGSISGLAVMTDGLQLLSIHHVSNVAHAQFFEPLFKFVSRDTSTTNELMAFLGSNRVCSSTDDDKTIVLAVLTQNERQA